MAGFITLPQALSMVVGGVPVQPAGGNTIIEKLRAAKSMIPGDVSSILGKVMQNGPGALLQNPVGGLLGQMNGQLSGIVSKITSQITDGNLGSIGNLSGVLTSLTGAGGLSSAVGSLSGVTNSLSGLAPGGSGFGLMDAIGHANIVGMLGSSLPAGLGMSEAMGPLMMGQNLTGMVSQLTGISNNVLSPSFNANSAVGTITGMASQINGVIDASNHAFSTVQSQVIAISQATAAISLLSNNTAGFADIANMIIRPDQMSEIQTAINNQLS